MSGSAGGNSKNLCFYSNKDPWSKAFLEELRGTPWVAEFSFVCVDPSANRPVLPKWLKQVPTLVINGEKEPIKTDTEVMNWLYERKMRSRPSAAAAQTPSAGSTVPAEPESWVGGEMNGFARSGYSFIDSDTSTAGNGGVTMPGSFAFLHGGASPGDRQSLEASTSKVPMTKKEKQFEDQLSLYKQQRDVGMKQGPGRV
jgi:hypothetical protein